MNDVREDSLDYPFPDLPGEAQLREVARGVYWLRMALPFALDHINLWLLEDGAGMTLVDTGVGDAASRDIWRRVLAGLPRPVTRILVTHYHPDHIGNAAWLAAETGAPVWMSTAEYLLAHVLHKEIGGYDFVSMAAHFRRHGLDEARCQKLVARGNVYARSAPELPTQYRRLIDGYAIDIDGDAWMPIVGYGHSPEHIALHCPARGVLISGDMLLPRITTNVNVPAAAPDEDAVTRFIESVRRFAGLPADTLVLPSHGLPFRGVRTRVAQLEAHHEERDAVLLAALAEPRSAGEILSTLFTRELDAHQVMFAMGEAIAHLNQLMHRRLVRRSVDASGLIRFVVNGAPAGEDAVTA